MIENKIKEACLKQFTLAGKKKKKNTHLHVQADSSQHRHVPLLLPDAVLCGFGYHNHLHTWGLQCQLLVWLLVGNLRGKKMVP